MDTECVWPIDYSPCNASGFLSTVDDAVKESAERFSIELLNNWTGGVFGQCPTSIRPCKAFEANRFNGGSRWAPVYSRGKWLDLACGACGDYCKCDRGPSSLSLPGYASSIISVVQDGITLDPSEYWLSENKYLIRTDGDTWPQVQDLNLPTTELDTFEVSYMAGKPLPYAGSVATGVLATEIMRSMCNDSKCQLPERVQSIVRAGVTMTFLDAFEGLEDGRTGLWLVDSWVASVRSQKSGARVYSVDTI